MAFLVFIPLPLGSNRDASMAFLVAWVGLIALVWASGWLFNLRFWQWRRVHRVGLVLAGLLLLFQAWVGLQLAAGWTLDSYATFKYLMLGLAYSVLFVVVLDVFKTRQRLVWLIAALLVSGTLQALLGTMRAFGELSGLFGWLFESSRQVATGTFVNRNHFAGYLEMTLALGIGLMLAFRTGRDWSWVGFLELLLSPKMMIRLALILMVIALVMTQSRMGNTAFMVSLLVVSVLFIARNPLNRVRNGLIILSILLIDVLIISQYFGLERLKDRVFSTEVSVTVDQGNLIVNLDDLRGLAFERGLPLAMEKPWVGQGAGTYELAFMPYSGIDFGGHFDHAHNDFLQFWIEFGLIGSLLLLAFLALSFYFALKALWMRESLFRSGLGFGVTMALLSITIHSFFDFNLQIPANAATFVVVCALAVLAPYHSHEPKSSVR
ncbi:O-antigen ligase family protein [Thiomicrospira sp. R3]|uniref:O-antigen ligase family protein n=1 Tax=Thiomicrospira sp. R3 TaxID=3035472 RepID=UPI00259BE2C7|nr:O-antigen ligase family protein [Thiomicrospira sp. R3]WFE68435.1 O-antigen ligase family protein [Thiomicrospira sp. R3]